MKRVYVNHNLEKRMSWTADSACHVFPTVVTMNRKGSRSFTFANTLARIEHVRRSAIIVTETSVDVMGSAWTARANRTAADSLLKITMVVVYQGWF